MSLCIYLNFFLVPTRYKRGFKAIYFNVKKSTVLWKLWKDVLAWKVSNTWVGCFPSLGKREKVPINCAKNFIWTCKWTHFDMRIMEEERKNQMRKITRERHMQRKLKVIKYISRSQHSVKVKKRWNQALCQCNQICF